MDDIDRQLLIALQKDIPLQPRPFEVLGRRLRLDSAEVLLRVHRLIEEKVILSLNPVFDTEKLGYRAHLIAFQVPSEYEDKAGNIVARHPAVTSCTIRKGAFNLWFVLVLSHEEPLESHVRQLQELTGVEKALIFQSGKIYKPVLKDHSWNKNLEKLDSFEKALIAAISEEFPLTDEPFGRLAKQMGSSEEWVLQHMQFFQKRGMLKKIHAVLKEAKPAASTLVVWQIPGEKQDRAGSELALRREVSFCGTRTAFIEFPYTLHAMIDLEAGQELDQLLKYFENGIGLWPRHCFYKEKEFKKSQMKFFKKEIEDWRIHYRVDADSAVSTH